MRFCKDCKHIQIGSTGMEFAKCGRTAKSVLDLVSGEIQSTPAKYCSTVRETELPEYCGEGGRFFKCKACDNMEGDYCSEECADEAHKVAMEEHGWMRDRPLSSVTGVLNDDERQDLRDAGRGHLVRE